MKYLVGKIIGTHGIKGELKVINESSFDRFKPEKVLFIETDNKFEKIVINSVRIHKGFYLITINGLDNINDVLKYVNLNLYTDEHKKLENGKYYYDDLINCSVYDMDNKLIGKVLDIMELPKGELLEINKIDNTTCLVPFVKEFVRNVDLDNKKIIIDPIEGLI